MFGTSGIRGEVGRDVTADLALAVGRAVASEGYERVVVGRDTRTSGDLLADAVSAGLRECGADVVRLGKATTPTVARSADWLGADAGIVVTASHNPPKDNGLKLWNPSGPSFDQAQRKAITRRVEAESFTMRSWSELGSEREWPEAGDRHVASLRGACADVTALDVVVDVGNGAGQLTAEALTALGCQVTTLNAQPDGHFPSRPSEPTAETCQRLRSVVANSAADFGVAHDGDADRMMAVAGDGTFVDGDLLLALFGRAVAGSGDSVAAPLNTSLVVDDALDEVGASVVRTRVGDGFVAERTTESDVVFGGEPSGAWIWPDDTLCPDGPLAACRLAELVHEFGPLTDQLDSLEPYPTRRESYPVEAKLDAMTDVSRAVRSRYDAVDATDGVRVDVGDGWFLIRASGTQPLVRVTAEARDDERANQLFERASDLVTNVNKPPSQS